MVDYSSFNPMKICYWRDQIDHLLNGEMVDPVLLTIDPSNQCNQNCGWCFTKQYREANPVNLSADLMQKLIASVALRVKAITYCGGGEPLMNPSLGDALRLGKAAGIQQGLITNGTAWHSPEIIKTIVECCDFVRVSLDAGDPTTYQKLHGVNLFNHAIEFLQYLLLFRDTSPCKVNVSVMICPTNVNDLSGIAAYFKDVGVDGITFKYAYSDYPGLDLAFDTNQFIAQNRELITTELEFAKILEDDHFKVMFRHPGTFDQGSIDHLSKHYQKCYIQPLGMAGIAANGDVYCCCDRRGDMILGNLAEADFWDLWYSAKHYEILKHIDLTECPTRCAMTDMNEIVERGFMKNEFDWNEI